MWRIVLYVIGLPIVLLVGALVVWSVLGDADMLTDAGGPWMLLVYLVVPVLVALYTFGPRLRRWLDEERAIRRVGRR
jgi:hypothetical protein